MPCRRARGPCPACTRRRAFLEKRRSRRQPGPAREPGAWRPSSSRLYLFLSNTVCAAFLQDPPGAMHIKRCLAPPQDQGKRVIGNIVREQYRILSRIEACAEKERCHGRKPGKQYRQFETDGHKRKGGVVRLAADIQRPVKHCGVELECQGEREGAKTYDESHPGQARAPDPHRL